MSYARDEGVQVEIQVVIEREERRQELQRRGWGGDRRRERQEMRTFDVEGMVRVRIEIEKGRGGGRRLDLRRGVEAEREMMCLATTEGE